MSRIHNGRFYRTLRSGRIIITNDGWLVIHLIIAAVMIGFIIALGVELNRYHQVNECIHGSAQYYQTHNCYSTFNGFGE